MIFVIVGGGFLVGFGTAYAGGCTSGHGISGHWIGGTLFGAGWTLTGACPGPLFALIGSGATVFAAAVVSTLAGTWAYGYLRPYLPHY